MAEQSFWATMGPGLLEQVGTYATDRRSAQEREKLLRRAQGPLYDQQQQMAGQSLALARGMDPKAMAAERFAEQQKLLAPQYASDEQNLMQQLQAKGLLGMSTYSAQPGVATGTSMNPYYAAMMASREQGRQKSAFDSLREGEAHLDSLIKRSGSLQDQGTANAMRQQQLLSRGQIPGRKPSILDQALKGGMKLLSNKPAQDAVWEQLKRIPGMLGFGFQPGSSYANEDWAPGEY